ncbi:hypothetical protein SpAn4DRAFT_1692 [Sporomusa ovata]|uniref:Uncharacterized protein n=1 Tax=Sporomusa ovata TaxID=2378 RepID=A0A0U1KVL2_9FIRM|nr:hypothetical protein SpAn4DRAFT_1692 [Sporomusa ovata]
MLALSRTFYTGRLPTGFSRGDNIMKQFSSIAWVLPLPGYSKFTKLNFFALEQILILLR